MASGLCCCKFCGGVVSLKIVLCPHSNKSKMVSQYGRYMANQKLHPSLLIVVPALTHDCAIVIYTSLPLKDSNTITAFYI